MIRIRESGIQEFYNKSILNIINTISSWIENYSPSSSGYIIVESSQIYDWHLKMELKKDTVKVKNWDQNIWSVEYTLIFASINISTPHSPWIQKPRPLLDRREKKFLYIYTYSRCQFVVINNAKTDIYYK